MGQLSLFEIVQTLSSEYVLRIVPVNLSNCSWPSWQVMRSWFLIGARVDSLEMQVLGGLLVERPEYFVGELPPQLLNLEFIQPILLVFLFHLLRNIAQLLLQLLNLHVLPLDLLSQFLLLIQFLPFRLS